MPGLVVNKPIKTPAEPRSFVLGDRPRVIFTRPEGEHAHGFESLKEAGYPVEHWPLIHIQPHPSNESLARACEHWRQWRAVFFVSPQAVLYFFRYAGTKLDLRHTRCWATGSGTRDALLRHGVAQDLIDTPNLANGLWDSEHLWQSVKEQIRPLDGVLIVRGGEVQTLSSVLSPSAEVASPPRHDTGVGREYLAEQIKAQGGQVIWAVAYMRAAPNWSAQQVKQAAQALCDGSIWIFTSSQAVNNWRQLMGEARGPWPQGRAIATHDRIAQALSAAGMGVVARSRPNLDALLVSLESMP